MFLFIVRYTYIYIHIVHIYPWFFNQKSSRRFRCHKKKCAFFFVLNVEASGWRLRPPKIVKLDGGKAWNQVVLRHQKKIPGVYLQHSRASGKWHQITAYFEEFCPLAMNGIGRVSIIIKKNANLKELKEWFQDLFDQAAVWASNLPEGSPNGGFL